MTYCVGLKTRKGLIFMSDTRTNAGLDNISTFSKMRSWSVPGERVIVLLSAGNLATTQAVASVIEEQIRAADPQQPSIFTTASMFQTARHIGAVVQEVIRSTAPVGQTSDGFSASFILGGQIRGDATRLFYIYPEGNFIEASTDTPFFQIGEHKYGKPILDRAVNFETTLPVALKLALISMDSTIRSNLGVGLPIDIITIPRDTQQASIVHRIEAGEPYFHDLRERWSAALRAAHTAIPLPPYGGAAS